MKKFAIAVLAGLVGYIAGAIGGYFLIATFSSNTHDRSVEAAMTGAFAAGPIAAIVAAVAAMMYFRKPIAR